MSLVCSATARDVLKTALCPLIASTRGQWEDDQAALNSAIASLSLESPPVSVPSQQHTKDPLLQDASQV